MHSGSCLRLADSILPRNAVRLRPDLHARAASCPARCGIAHAFAEAGAPVVAVARTGPGLAELTATGAKIRTEVADAADETVAWSLLDRYEPEVLVLVAGLQELS